MAFLERVVLVNCSRLWVDSPYERTPSAVLPALVDLYKISHRVKVALNFEVIRNIDFRYKRKLLLKHQLCFLQIGPLWEIGQYEANEIVFGLFFVQTLGGMGVITVHIIRIGLYKMLYYTFL